MTFLDTNILLYAFGQNDDTDRPEKARRILSRDDLAFSVQVFQEFIVQATHSRHGDPLTSKEAMEVIDSVSAFPVQVNDLPLLREAVALQSRYQTSFRDASILAAAKALGCEVVLSEDLGDGQDYGNVSVINPFRDDT